MRIRSAIREIVMSALLLRTIVLALAMLGVGMEASAMEAPTGLPSDWPAAPPQGPTDWRYWAPGGMALPDGFVTDGASPFLLLAIPHARTPLVGPDAPSTPYERSNDYAARPGEMPDPVGPHVCGLMPPPEGSLPDDGMARVLATCGQLFGASDAALTAIETLHSRVDVPAGAADAFLAEGFVPPVPVPPG